MEQIANPHAVGIVVGFAIVLVILLIYIIIKLSNDIVGWCIEGGEKKKKKEEQQKHEIIW